MKERLEQQIRFLLEDNPRLARKPRRAHLEKYKSEPVETLSYKIDRMCDLEKMRRIHEKKEVCTCVD